MLTGARGTGAGGGAGDDRVRPTKTIASNRIATITAPSFLEIDTFIAQFDGSCS
jgi:hypothetical protein